MKSVIDGILDTCELEIWYDTENGTKYTYCWLGAEMYYATEIVNLN